MSRKDFIVLAAEIRNLLDPAQRLNAATAAAAACAKLNPRFNARKFFEACGVVK